MQVLALSSSMVSAGKGWDRGRGGIGKVYPLPTCHVAAWFPIMAVSVVSRAGSPWILQIVYISWGILQLWITAMQSRSRPLA